MDAVLELVFRKPKMPEITEIIAKMMAHLSIQSPLIWLRF